VHVRKAYYGSRGIAPFILLDESESSSLFLSPLIQGKNLLYQLIMMLGGTQEMFCMSWRRGKINTLPLPGIESFVFQPIAYGI